MSPFDGVAVFTLPTSHDMYPGTFTIHRKAQMYGTFHSQKLVHGMPIIRLVPNEYWKLISMIKIQSPFTCIFLDRIHGERKPCHGKVVFVILSNMNALRQRLPVMLEWSVLLLLALSILWRGGKRLEATWLLAGLAVLLTFARWWNEPRDSDTPVTSVPRDLWIAMMLFLLWTVVSYVLSETRNYGLDEVIRDASCVLVFLWATRAGRNAPTEPSGRCIRRLITVISVTALVTCVIGTAVYILQPVNRFVGTFFDMRFDTDYWPNAWAEFLLLAWPIAVLWSRRFSPFVQSLTLGMLFGSLFLSYSRGAFLVFCGQIVLWLLIAGVRWWISRGEENHTGWRSPTRTLIVALGALIIGALLFTGVNAVRSRFHDVASVAAKATFTASEGASSISERSDFWEQSFALSLERPVFGWGPYSFRFIQPRLQTQVFATSDHPHNVFLKLAMERGWPAALLFLFILIRMLFPAASSLIRRKAVPRLRAVTPLFVHSLRHYGVQARGAEGALRGAGEDGPPVSLQMACLIAVSGVLAHNLIDYNLQFVGIALPVWLLLGLLVRAPLESAPLRSGYSPCGASNKCIRTFELTLTIVLAVTLVLEGRFLLLSSFGRHSESAGNLPVAIQWYDRASGELFSRDMHLSRAHLFLQQGNEHAARAALDDYAQVNDEDARLWILRGRLATSKGDSEEALRDYEIAMELGKLNYLEPLEGILTILATGAHPEVTAAQEASFLALLRSFGSAILRNSHFIALSGSVETFERANALLRKLYPAESESLGEYGNSVLAHAEKERAAYASRSPGFLW